MKKSIILMATCVSALMLAQEKERNKFRFSGSYEGYGQWYNKDEKRGIQKFEKPLRSNNYLNLQLGYGRFSVTAQVEAYEKEALLNFNPKYKGVDFGTYALNYKDDKFEATLGHFYEQFGSGIALRAWEDRAIGINNAIRGARVKFRPTENIDFTALYGKNRSGFSVSKGSIMGADFNVDIANILNVSSFGLSYGTSWVNRYEKLPEEVKSISPDTNIFSNRLSFDKGNFYTSVEYNYKTKDALLNRLGTGSKVDYDFVKSGNAFLLNIGYSKSGFGIDANFRRLENMQLLSERQPVGVGGQSSLTFNDNVLNFLPSMTKQHHSNLANIYVYQTQSQVDFIKSLGEETKRLGTEIAGQVDLFYKFKRKSFLGGKYGTKVSANFSTANSIKPKSLQYGSSTQNPDYEMTLLDTEINYYKEYSVEIAKKLSPKISGNISFIKQYYDSKEITGIPSQPKVNTSILFAEGVFILPKYRSIKASVEHMWADADRKNWIGGSIEYTHNKHWSLFVTDLYNYGFDEKEQYLVNDIDRFKIHFYNAGITYRNGRHRIAVNYGRQRGGLVCAGGVCRFVPPSTGLGVQLSTSF
ncbi:MAG: hypothetical protein CSA38_02795 [Flavobacteriales bacterium]|nr:MAG: hypothetical protein CSA38_02795 [Flavobacteriales bacterium]